MEIADLLAHPTFMGASLMQVSSVTGVRTCLSAVAVRAEKCSHCSCSGVTVGLHCVLHDVALQVTHVVSALPTISLCAPCDAGDWAPPCLCSVKGAGSKAARARRRLQQQPHPPAGARDTLAAGVC